MNHNQPGQGWNSQQYGYLDTQQQQGHGYGQQMRQPSQQQPMVVIPRLSQEDVAQYYPQQHGFNQSPVAATLPSPVTHYQQSPQQQTQSSLSQQMQQMQYMQQYQMQQLQQAQNSRVQQAQNTQFQQQRVQQVQHQSPTQHVQQQQQHHHHQSPTQHVQQQQQHHHQSPIQQAQQQQRQQQLQYPSYPQQQFNSPQYQQQSHMDLNVYQMPLSGIHAYASPQLSHLQLQQGHYPPASPVQQSLRRTSSQSLAGNLQAPMHRATSQSVPSPMQTQQSRAGSQSAPSPMQPTQMRTQHQQHAPVAAHSHLQQAISQPMPSPVQPPQRPSPQQIHNSQAAVAQQHRVSSHVEIPKANQAVQRERAPPVVKASDRSINNSVNSLSQAPFPRKLQPQTQPDPPPQQVPKPLPQHKNLTNGTLVKPTTAAVPSMPSALSLDGSSHDEPDYHLLLLALADQYICAARSMAHSLSRSQSQTDMSTYQDLIYQGLTCLDSALTNWKTSDARGEARLRLYYANLLFEETDDDDTALAVLTKGITLCDRNRLNNQKLSLQHLQARIQYKTNRKAALKSIDSILEELVAYKNTPWIYVFRFLKVSLSLQANARGSSSTTLQQLKSLVTLAEAKRDIPILVLVHVLEAMVHLRSTATDAFEHARAAVAAASSHQLDQSLEHIPQLRVLLYLADLSYDLATNSLAQVTRKMALLQGLIDGVNNGDTYWRTSFRVPTSVTTEEDVSDQTSGILNPTKNGKISITFKWLSESELCVLGLLMTGAVRLQKSCVDELAEQYLSEAIRHARGPYKQKKTPHRSLNTVCVSMAREESLCVAAETLLILALANRSNWSKAAEWLAETKRSHMPSAMARYEQLLQYLDGVIKQGSGSLQDALRIYASPSLTVVDSTGKRNGPDLDIRIMATLNRVAILKFSPATRAEAEELLDSIFQLCQNHHNLGIKAAANMLKTINTTKSEVIKFKTFLQTSLQAAQKAGNSQMIALALNIMGARFFAGIVGDQANKSALVNLQSSQKLRSPLWLSVSGMQLSNCDTVNNKPAAAQQHMESASRCWNQVTPGVKAHFTTTND